MAGFTRLDHPLLEAIIAAPLTKRQLKILLLIVRYSTGYQKSYALLKKRDFSAAGVSPYCVTGELKKLVALGVIHWDPEKDAFWVNPDPAAWRVEIPGENLGRLGRIGGKNSLKGQLNLYQETHPQVAKTTTPYIDNRKLQKEELYRELLREYLSSVAPLTGLEADSLRQVIMTYPVEALRQAMQDMASSKEKNFSNFLSKLDGRTAELRPSNMRSKLRGFWQRLPRP